MHEGIRPAVRFATVSILWLMALAGLAPVLAQPSSVASIPKVNCDRRGGAAILSFRVEGAMGSQLRSVLESGQSVPMTHVIGITKRRALWFTKQLASVRIDVSARLDTLTQRYTLSRTIDDGPLETATTDVPAEMERWLTEVTTMRIPLPAESAGGTLDAKVRSFYGDDYLLFFLPRRLRAVGSAECR